MKFFVIAPCTLLIFLSYSSCRQPGKTSALKDIDKMIVRISEITIDSPYLAQYISILKEEAEASVRLEPGVISIFPMFKKENPTEIRILEIYADQQAYQEHLQTPHFKHYKTSTLKMVKHLELIDLKAIDGAAMSNIFKKLN